MNRIFYTISLYFLSPIIWIYFCYRGFSDPRYLKNLKQRLGFVPAVIKNSIHIHCASVGETLAAKPLIKKIAAEYSQKSIVITSTTPTGQEQVARLLEEINHPNIQHCYLPIDWAGSCKRFINNIKPELTILMETELWPNLLNQLSKNNIPILLANARLSDSSLRKYQKYPKLSKEIFSTLSLVAAQYYSDKENYQTLGVPENKINLMGNIKFDLELSNKLRDKQNEIKTDWTANRPSWIAASIHPDEFSAILTTHIRLLEHFPDLLLIAVPRHPEFFSSFKQACKKSNLNYLNRSDNITPGRDNNVLVGDTMGELTLMCGAADIAFVGGSLIDRGGHNPLEPAACRLPVIMGESDYNFSDICQIMRDAKILDVIINEQDLFQALNRLLSDPVLLKSKSEATNKIFEINRGAVGRIMQSIDKLINS